MATDYYWELTYGDFRDTKRILLPPAVVPVVQRKWDAGETVHLKGRASIPANQIRSLEKTDQPFGLQGLLEGAAQAFHEPLVTEAGDMKAQWVKKVVTADRYHRYYSQLPAYRRLPSDGEMVTVAFRLPTHQVNSAIVTACTPDEIRLLT